MIRQPRVDTPSWDSVLAHRPDDARRGVAERFEESGVSPDLVRLVLEDGGDSLHAAARGGDSNWAERFGGWLGVALLSAEVSALASHLNARASAVRSLAVDQLLEDFSAVTVAAHLGVSRQKIYEISRGRRDGHFIDRVPWRYKQ